MQFKAALLSGGFDEIAADVSIIDRSTVCAHVRVKIDTKSSHLFSLQIKSTAVHRNCIHKRTKLHLQSDSCKQNTETEYTTVYCIDDAKESNTVID